MQQHQFRINTMLSVCAVHMSEVVTVLSSIEKTDGVSTSYLFSINPKCPIDKKNQHFLSHATPTTGSNQELECGLQELRILNAFATLLSRDSENITVTSGVTVLSQKQTNDVNVNLVVCVDINPPQLPVAMAWGSQAADEPASEEGLFLADPKSALRHPEKPYSLIESNHASAGIDVSKGSHAFVKECL